MRKAAGTPAAGALPTGTIACAATWHTDFRADLPKIDIPVLVLYGSADRILPIEACGPRTHELIPGSEYGVIDGADHGLCWTHADEVTSTSSGSSISPDFRLTEPGRWPVARGI